MVQKCTFLLLALLLGVCAPSNSAAQSTTQAILLEAAESSLCYADCPIIPLPNVYGVDIYCFQAGDKILVGEHHAWEIGLKKLTSLEGRTLPLRYDDAHISVKLPSGWQVGLNQYYNEYFFKNLTCRAAAEMRSLEHGYTRPAPVPDEPAEPVMHGKLVYGWTMCSAYLNEHLVPYDGLFNCTVWDLMGEIRQKGTYKQIGAPVSSTQTVAWDDATDGVFKILHLRKGRTLKLIDFTRDSPFPNDERLPQH
jgi:hypothetical protein